MLPKLVRDKVLQQIDDSGRTYRAHIADSPEYADFLRLKMTEEVGELYETPTLSEAADVYEVFLTMLDNFNLQLSDVIQTAEYKRDISGAFYQGIILDEVIKKKEKT